MARTNLHELANRLLDGLSREARDGLFEGKLREVAASAGLNSVRSAEAIKLLSEMDRIEIVQRGRRGRDTIISIKSTQPISLEDAERMLPSRASKRGARLNYDDLGRAVVDRLLQLARDDALRAAQVEAFASDAGRQRERVSELEAELTEARERETQLRIQLKTAQEALERAEENLRKAFGTRRADESPGRDDDEDTRALLNVLRSGGL